MCNIQGSYNNKLQQEQKTICDSEVYGWFINRWRKEVLGAVVVVVVVLCSVIDIFICQLQLPVKDLDFIIALWLLKENQHLPVVTFKSFPSDLTRFH